MDSANNFLVGVRGEHLVFPTCRFRTCDVPGVDRRELKVEEALNLAAWIVALAPAIDAEAEGKFRRMLEEVKAT